MSSRFASGRRLALTIAAALVAAGCDSSPITPPVDAEAEPQLEVANVLNGTPTSRFRSVAHGCNLVEDLTPYEGSSVFTIIDGWACFPGTFVLVSPHVALVSAHAAPFIEATKPLAIAMRFAPSISGEGPMVTGRYVPHPDWDPADPAVNDVAVLLLDEPVYNVRPARLPRRVGEVDRRVRPGRTRATLVGYGLTEADDELVDPQWGVRAVARTTIADVDPGYVTVVPSKRAPGSGCNGDSGSPVFRGNGQGQVVYGLGSVIGGPECSYLAYSRVDTESVRDFLAEYLPERLLPRPRRR